MVDPLVTVIVYSEESATSLSDVHDALEDAQRALAQSEPPPAAAELAGSIETLLDLAMEATSQADDLRDLRQFDQTDKRWAQATVELRAHSRALKRTCNLTESPQFFDAPCYGPEAAEWYYRAFARILEHEQLAVGVQQDLQAALPDLRAVEAVLVRATHNVDAVREAEEADVPPEPLAALQQKILALYSFTGNLWSRMLSGNLDDIDVEQAQTEANAVLLEMHREQARLDIACTTDVVATDLRTPGSRKSSAAGVNAPAGARAPVVDVEQATPVAMPTYTVTELPTLGGETSRAFGINNAGQVVGEAEDAQGRQRAVLWQDGGVADLGTLGGPESIALEISDTGWIVGASTTDDGQDLYDAGTHAFLWRDGRMTDLGTLGGASSAAGHVNAGGQVVGDAETAAGETHAFLWADGNMIDLGTLGGTRSAALTINDVGVVVGYATTAEGVTRAFRWVDGRMTDLGEPVDEESAAGGINASGRVVGWVRPATEVQHAAVWDDGVVTDLGTLGGEWALATVVNGHGQTVGISTTAPGQQPFEPGTHAFLWDGADLVDLNRTIPPDRAWRLTVANGINDAGQIVGFGTLREATRAFVMTPIVRR
jgi:probable HAF family extracellular repeat protein